MAPTAKQKGVFATSDRLDENLDNIGKTEREYKQTQELNHKLKYKPQPEVPDTQDKLSQGWLKHADEVYPASAEGHHRPSEHVTVAKDNDGRAFQHLPEPRKRAMMAPKSKADILKPKRGNDRISKPKAKPKAKVKPPRAMATLAQRFGGTMNVNKATLHDLEESTKPAGAAVASQPGWFGHVAAVGKGWLSAAAMTSKDAAPTDRHKGKLCANCGSYVEGAADGSREVGRKGKQSRQ